SGLRLAHPVHGHLPADAAAAVRGHRGGGARGDRGRERRGAAGLMPIIDVHAHVGPWPFHMDTGDAGFNLRLMDRYGIDLQLVSAAEAVVYDAVAGNAALREVLAVHPRLLG